MYPVLLFAILAQVTAHSHHEQQSMQSDLDRLVDVVDVSAEPWTSQFGPQIDLGYTGPLSFSHLPYTRCLDQAVLFDIGIIGMPFDTTTSYRPGKSNYAT